MATFNKPPLAYGQSQPLVPVMPMVAQIAGVPTANTRGVLGQMLLNSLAPGNIYMLTGIIAGAAQWTLVAGGAGNFNSLTVTTSIAAGTTITAGTSIVSTAGNITASAGNIVATVGNVTAGGSMSAGTTLTAATGITATTGNIRAVAGGVYAAGDGSGLAGYTGITNVVNATQGAGLLTLLSTNGNAGTNAGFMKCYVGATTVYVPYFTNIAP